MSILDSLPHSASAYPRVRVPDSMGGSRDSLGSAIFSGRPCWRQVMREREVFEYMKRGFHVTDKVYFTSDPGLDDRHILVVDGDTLEVVSTAIPDASAGMGVVWRVMARISSTGST